MRIHVPADYLRGLSFPLAACFKLCAARQTGASALLLTIDLMQRYISQMNQNAEATSLRHCRCSSELI